MLDELLCVLYSSFDHAMFASAVYNIYGIVYTIQYNIVCALYIYIIPLTLDNILYTTEIHFRYRILMYWFNNILLYSNYNNNNMHGNKKNLTA